MSCTVFPKLCRQLLSLVTDLFLFRMTFSVESGTFPVALFQMDVDSWKQMMDLSRLKMLFPDYDEERLVVDGEYSRLPRV